MTTPLNPWLNAYLTLPALYEDITPVKDSDWKKIEQDMCDTMKAHIEGIDIDIDVKVNFYDEEPSYDIDQSASLNSQDLEKTFSLVNDNVATLLDESKTRYEAVIKSFYEEFTHRIDLIVEQKIFDHDDVQSYLYDWLYQGDKYGLSIKMMQYVLQTQSLEMNALTIQSLPSVNATSGFSKYWKEILSWDPKKLTDTQQMWGEWLLGKKADPDYGSYTQATWVYATIAEQPRQLDLLERFGYHPPQQLEKLRLSTLMEAADERVGRQEVTSRFLEKHLEALIACFPEWSLKEAFPQEKPRFNSFYASQKTYEEVYSLSALHDALSEPVWDKCKALIEKGQLKRDTEQPRKKHRTGYRL